MSSIALHDLRRGGLMEDVLFVGGAAYSFEEVQAVGAGRFVGFALHQVWKVLL